MKIFTYTSDPYFDNIQQSKFPYIIRYYFCIPLYLYKYIIYVCIILLKNWIIKRNEVYDF